MNRFPLAAMAILLLAGLASSCEKPDDQPVIPDPEPIPGENVTVMTDATSLLYYGDRKTEGLYNYFVGFCSTAITEDSDGYLIPSGDGCMVKVDFYSSTPSDSWQAAVLPDGTYILQGSGEELSAGMLHNYYTRIETVKDGNVKSTDFASGSIEVSSNGTVKIVKGSFKLTNGDDFKFSYEGELLTADPDASQVLPPMTDPIDVTMNLAAGAYYGDDYKMGADRYEIALTNAPVNSYGEINGAGHMLYLSMFDTPSSIIGLSAGTYTVDDTYAAKTIEKGEIILDVTGSFIVKYNESGETENFCLITAGTVTVALSGTRYTITADLTAEEDLPVKATYSGEIDFEDNSSSGSQSPSTITGDLDFRFADNSEVYIQYFGDYYGTGTDNWYIEIADASNYIIIDLNTPQAGFSETIPFPESGQYNMSVDYGTGMLTGVLEGDEAIGTWYFDLTKDNVYAAAIDGTIKHTKSGETDILKIELLDENYNLISAQWQGMLPAASNEAGYSAASASRAQSCRTPVKRSPAIIRPSAKSNRIGFGRRP
ncbi:MAG: hypothetical protein K2O58_07830 [Bacteroidales bacterium]|nr:hypothetical protein [Bacteroidales bacterium]